MNRYRNLIQRIELLEAEATKDQMRRGFDLNAMEGLLAEMVERVVKLEGVMKPIEWGEESADQMEFTPGEGGIWGVTAMFTPANRYPADRGALINALVGGGSDSRRAFNESPEFRAALVCLADVWPMLRDAMLDMRRIGR